jgi:hypothetical protein
MTMPRAGILPMVHFGPVYRQLAVVADMTMLQLAAFRQLRRPNYQLVLPPKDGPDIKRHRDGRRPTIENLLPGTYMAICHPRLRGTALADIDNLKERRGG